MTLVDVLRNPPLLHIDNSGEPVFWGVSNELLSFIDTHISPGARTIETGAGVSTLVFAMKGAFHTCVVPDHELVERIKAYAINNRISLERVAFEVGRSEEVLPRLKLTQLDCILIDGRHAFPSPFIDWYYTSPALKLEGFLIIDDTHLWTGNVLSEFLSAEREWTVAADFQPRSIVFTKTGEVTHDKEWNEQAYVVENSLELYPTNLQDLGKYIAPAMLKRENLTTSKNWLRKFRNMVGNSR